jgi:magnesium-transporting ATPase (P-type)
MPEGPEDKLVYSGSSPDETALVYAAKHHGFFFTAREPGKVTVKIKGKTVDFNVLHVLEFTSDRKKSSVVLRREDGSIVLFCKGADNIIKGRLSSTLNSPKEMAGIEADIAQYVNDGLRTLLLAKAELTESQYGDWAGRYHEAETSIKGRDAKRYVLMEELERELEVMGITAIEDKLQEGVPETIFALRQAGIKVWVLTGDKVDTAINIGFSCQLLAMDMKLLRLCGEDGGMVMDNEKIPLKEPIQERMRAMVEAEAKAAAAAAAAGGMLPPRALIVDTYALAAILKYELQDLMLALCHLCVSVVCARVSPRQKAMVVEMVKKADPSVQTLSIGTCA